MKKLFLFLACSLACLAQAATDTLSCPSSVRAGANLVCIMSVASGGTAAGIEFQITVSASTGALVVTTIGTAQTAGKTAQCNSTGLCILSGLNQVTVPDGSAASITIPIPVAASGTMMVAISNVVTASLGGVGIPTTANPPVAVSVLSSCDINGDGATNSTDVALTVGNALATPQVPTDLNKDGKTDVVDVQIVVNAASGKGCIAQ
jgi:hypothetical protein